MTRPIYEAPLAADFASFSLTTTSSEGISLGAALNSGATSSTGSSISWSLDLIGTTPAGVCAAGVVEATLETGAGFATGVTLPFTCFSSSSHFATMSLINASEALSSNLLILSRFSRNIVSINWKFSLWGSLCHLLRKFLHLFLTHPAIGSYNVLLSPLNQPSDGLICPIGAGLKLLLEDGPLPDEDGLWELYDWFEFPDNWFEFPDGSELSMFCEFTLPLPVLIGGAWGIDLACGISGASSGASAAGLVILNRLPISPFKFWINSLTLALINVLKLTNGFAAKACSASTTKLL